MPDRTGGSRPDGRGFDARDGGRPVQQSGLWPDARGTLCPHLAPHRPYIPPCAVGQSRIMSATRHRTVSGMWWADADIAELRDLATLNRGYAIVSDAASGATLSHVSATRPGQTVRTLLADGSFTAEVKSVLAAIGAYFAVVHWGSLKVRRYWPKEIVVGCLFSVGTCLAVWTESAPGSQIQIALPALLFAALCSLNCVAIEYWEWDSRSASWPSQPSPLSLWMGRRVGPLSLITTGASIILLFTSNIDTRPLFIAIAFSSLALFQLSRPFRRLTASSRRVLADAALLTPLLLLAVQ